MSWSLNFQDSYLYNFRWIKNLMGPWPAICAHVWSCDFAFWVSTGILQVDTLFSSIRNIDLPAHHVVIHWHHLSIIPLSLTINHLTNSARTTWTTGLHQTVCHMHVGISPPGWLTPYTSIYVYIIIYIATEYTLCTVFTLICESKGILHCGLETPRFSLQGCRNQYFTCPLYHVPPLSSPSHLWLSDYSLLDNGSNEWE